MATKIAEKAVAKTVKEAEIQDELVVKAAEMEVPADVPIELIEKAEPVIQNYLDYLEERNEIYAQELGETQLKVEAGQPIVSGFQYWNVFTMGPYQFRGNPPYLPSRIIAANDWALMLGVIWLNPVIPSPWVFAGREYQVRFETINLSRVSDGPDGNLPPRVFPSAANLRSINPVVWWFQPREAGLYETTLTVDLTLAGMPFAAFSTWHYDPEPHLGIPGQTPSIPRPHWHHDVPARFMVYRE